MKKYSVTIEAEMYDIIDDHLEYLGVEDTKVVDFSDEEEARQWVDENAYDEALQLIGKTSDEVTLRAAEWKADGMMYRACFDADKHYIEVFFELHPLTGRFPWPESC